MIPRLVAVAKSGPQATSTYMIIFRVAQGTACTSQATVSDPTIHGMPGHLGHLSIIRFQAVSGEHAVTSVSQPRNQLPLDEFHVVSDVESNRYGILYESPTNSAGTTEIVGPNAN